MVNLYQIWHKKRCRIMAFKKTTSGKVTDLHRLPWDVWHKGSKLRDCFFELPALYMALDILCQNCSNFCHAC